MRVYDDHVKNFFFVVLRVEESEYNNNIERFLILWLGKHSKLTKQFHTLYEKYMPI